jgi:diguanylate cyclase (GGDEF)-like protein
MIKRWWIIASFFVLTVAVAGVVTFTQTPTYRTSATFVVSPSLYLVEQKGIVSGLDTLSRREGVIATYNQVFVSRAILAAAAERLGLTREQANTYGISSKVIPTTNVIQIRVEGASPAMVKTLADTLGEEAVEYSKNLYEVFTLKPLDEAKIPEEPALPNKTQNMVLAAVLGATLGGALAFLVDYLRGPTEAVPVLSVLHSETGAYNKQYFLQRVSEEISRVKRSGQPFSLALVQINRLDMVQDVPTAKARTEVLRQLTVFLRQHVREEDVIAYMENEQYAFLFPDTVGPNAQRMMERLQTRVAWNVFESQESGIKLFLTSTCGIVTVGHDELNRDELFLKVEQALKFAGTEGHGNVYLIDEVAAGA